MGPIMLFSSISRFRGIDNAVTSGVLDSSAAFFIFRLLLFLQIKMLKVMNRERQYRSNAATDDDFQAYVSGSWI